MGIFNWFSKKKDNEEQIPNSYPTDNYAQNYDNSNYQNQGFNQNSYDPNVNYGQNNSFMNNHQDNSLSGLSNMPNSDFKIRDVTNENIMGNANPNINHDQSLRDIKIEKNLEIISSKIDTLKVLIENMDHRLKSLENPQSLRKDSNVPYWKKNL
jgi:hypothetical protein